jgi:transcriptional regulator with XRE-family HTH domain
VKNFISLNISYLCKENKLTQKDFGELFDLKQNVVSSYIKENATPKVETIQQICEHFNISIDDFINKNMRTLRMERLWNNGDPANEPPALHGNAGYMQKTIETQEQLIEMLQAEISKNRFSVNARRHPWHLAKPAQRRSHRREHADKGI